MKRLHNKVLNAKLVHLANRTIGKLHVPKTKYTPLAYFITNANSFNILISIKMDFIELPLIDMYELRANSKDGAVAGYLFDPTTRNVSYSNNHIAVYENDFRLCSIRGLKGTSCNLKYRINGVYLYEYEGVASMVTTGLPESVCERMELSGA